MANGNGVTRPRNFAVAINGDLANGHATLQFCTPQTDPVPGKVLLQCNLGDIGADWDVMGVGVRHLLTYGVKQILADSVSDVDGRDAKLRGMAETWARIQKGEWRNGQRAVSGLIMADAFEAARAVGFKRDLDDEKAKVAWKGLTDMARLQIANREDVAALLAAKRGTSGTDELDAMFA